MSRKGLRLSSASHWYREIQFVRAAAQAIADALSERDGRPADAAPDATAERASKNKLLYADLEKLLQNRPKNRTQVESAMQLTNGNRDAAKSLLAAWRKHNRTQAKRKRNAGGI
jgi:hypothetical protein